MDLLVFWSFRAFGLWQLWCEVKKVHYTMLPDNELGRGFWSASASFSMLTQVYASISHTKCPKFVTEHKDERQAVHPSSSLPLSSVSQHVVGWSFESQPNHPKNNPKHPCPQPSNAWATKASQAFWSCASWGNGCYTAAVADPWSWRWPTSQLSLGKKSSV